MKKKLLFAGLLFSSISFGQGLTQANEPAIGATSAMYLCDSFATNYANIVGNGVTWDYSSISYFPGETRTISIVDPATTPNAGDFSGATKAVSIENFLTTYWTSTATERTSSGFVFNEPTFGEVKAIFAQDPQKLAEYEFSLNDEINDAFAGTLSFNFSGAPLSPDATGTSYSTIDGQGTLKLNATTTLTNVIRCLTIDTLNTVVPIIGDIQLIRAQYEYYHFATGNLPVFTHTTAKLSAPGATDPLTEFTVVLNSVEPSNIVGISENAAIEFSVYPNPAKEQITVRGDFNQSAAQIMDQTGKLVKEISALSSGSTIEISGLEKGIYFLVLTSNGSKSIQKFAKN